MNQVHAHQGDAQHQREPADQVGAADRLAPTRRREEARRDQPRRAAEDGQSESAPLQIPISRSDMADYLGLTIETVSRQLTRLKVMGAIALAKGGRSIDLTDMAILHSIADAG